MSSRLLCLLFSCAVASPSFGQTIERVSINTAGEQSNGPSGGARGISLNRDGRYVAFESLATNLAADDRNATSDVFVRARRTGTTELVSFGYNRLPGNGTSRHPSLSSLGRYVAFQSSASNLVYEDVNGWTDIFLHDRVFRQTYCISRAWPGGPANNESELPSISGDGRYTAFQSFASNLVPGDKNGFSDIFLYDRQTRQLKRLTVAASGGEANLSSRQADISESGRSIAFASLASNLVSGDTNGFEDVFVYDQDTGLIERVSEGLSGVPANERSVAPAISGDGRFVAFQSLASNLVPDDSNETWDIFVFDRQKGITRRVSVASDGGQADGASESPDLSADGRYLTFASTATNLVPLDFNDTSDVFLRDLLTDTTERVSLDWFDAEVIGTSSAPRISGDGRDVAFTSDAAELTENDSNGTFDVFVRDGIRLDVLGTLQVGSPVQFRISRAQRDGGDIAQILLSVSGRSPWRLPGGSNLRIPLTPDAWTHSSLTMGSLLIAPVGANGEGTTPPVTLPAVASGQTVYVAAVTLNPSNRQLHSATGSLVITIP